MYEKKNVFRTKRFYYNIILFKFVVETKLFEAWAYCLQTNLVFSR